jgi:putative methionine-R-sulfoxide reductase with GAF domain/ligand-binding sensor domain-containing protein
MANNLFAQDIPLDQLHIRRITAKDGLHNNGNRTFYQDKKGFMWIGGYGLQRYDGNRFTNVINQDNPNFIYLIAGDNNNNIFVNKGDGSFSHVDKQRNKIDIIQDSIDVKGKMTKLQIIKMVTDAKGNVWVKHANGYAVLRNGAKKLEPISNNWSLKATNFLYAWLKIEDNKYIWQSSAQDGIFRINIQNGTVTTKENCNPAEKIFFYDCKNSEVRIAKEKGDFFWIMYNNVGGEFIRIDASTMQTKIFVFPYKYPFSKKYKNIGVEEVHCDSKGTVWVVPLENIGLGRYNPKLDSIEILYSNTAKQNSLYSTITLASQGAGFLEDAESNIWLSGDGILFFNPNGQQFNTYVTKDIVDKAFKNPLEKITSSAATPNTVVQVKNKDYYIGYYGLGLLKFNSDFTNPVSIPLPKEINTLLWNMFTIDSVSLYIFDQNKHLSIYNTTLKSWKVMPDDIWKPRYVLSNYIENDTTVWLANAGWGMSKFNPKTFALTHYLDAQMIIPSKRCEIPQILPEGKDFLWVATYYNGLHLFDKKSGKSVKKIFPANNKEIIIENSIYNITRYNADTLFLHTMVGFIVFNTKTESKTYITTANGMPQSYCFASLVDINRNFVWISTATKGICKLNLKTLQVTIPPYEEGNTLEFANTEKLTLPNGDMLLTQQNGFTIVKGSAKFSDYKPGNVIIDDIVVNAAALHTDSIMENKRVLEFDESAKSIVISFTCLDYWSSRALQYYSYMKGIDTGWIAMGNKSQLEYRGLAAGNYTLQLKCAYQNGNYCKNITVLQINIKPPFYKTAAFVLLSAAAGFILLYSFLRWRNKQALNIAQLKTEKVQNELELEQIANYFAKSLADKKTVDETLWDISKNLIGKLGFTDCMMYLWNADKTKLIQKAGYGPKGSIEEINKQPFDVVLGQGVVGYAAEHKKAVLIQDTAKDKRYRADEEVRLSEITVPVLYNNELIGIIDSEHPEKNFFTQRHLNLLTTIATLTANKLQEIKTDAMLNQQQQAIEAVKTKLAETELAALRSQMNPHFIFNSLNSINSFIIDNDTLQASAYLTKFSRLIRLILDNSKNELISLRRELETLQLYLMMESVRFKNKFSWHININDEVDDEQITLPPTTLQPFVENAIWHGIMHLHTEGVLKIDIDYATDGRLLIAISDNGIGREKSALTKSKTNTNKSYGIAITKERLLQLHPLNEVIITDNYTADNIAAGTTVNIYITIT